MICQEKFCDYDSYYKEQAGGGLDIKYYRSVPRQRGSGFLSSLIRRVAFPALKFLGRQAISTGSDLISDILPGVSEAKKNLKRRAISTLKDISDKIEQSGSGRKRMKRKTSMKNRRRKSKIISSCAAKKKRLQKKIKRKIKRKPKRKKKFIKKSVKKISDIFS